MASTSVAYTLIDIETGQYTNEFPEESIIVNIEPPQIGGYLTTKDMECYEVVAIHQESGNKLIDVYVKHIGRADQALLAHIRSKL